MKNSEFRWFSYSSLVVGVVLVGACSEGPIAPVSATTSARPAAAVADVNYGNRLPDLTGCENLVAPVGSTLVLRAFGVGVQIYHWNGTSWGSSVPSATLHADAGSHGQIGTHFGGPTWLSNSGSQVVGTVAQRCPVDAGSIPWLSLTAVPSGPGIFSKVTFIQRLETVGGSAPSAPGTVIGQEARVPYTADYLFYQAP